jgi:hypothetical protein
LHLSAAGNATFAGSVDIHATTGDSLLQFNVDGDTYSMGIDNSDSDMFKISYGVFANNDILKLNTSLDAVFMGGLTIGGGAVSHDEFHLYSAGTKMGGMWGSGSGGYGKLNLRSAGNEKVLLNAGGDSYFNGGNVGIGQTPSTTSGYIVSLQIGEQANLFGHTAGTGAGSSTFLSNNITHNAGYKYITADSGCLYTQASGVHTFSNFVAGSAGAAATEQVRMRIVGGGYVYIGGTSNLGYNSHNIQLSAPSGYACIVRNSDTSTTNGSVIQFNRAETTATTGGYCVIYRQGDTNSGTNRWIVFANGNIQNTNNSYGSLSDERLKENIIDATPKLDDLMKVKVRNFNLKGEETKQIGVVAQELEGVFPGMIDESKTPDSEDETLYKGVKYSVFVPILIKSIQELKAEVETLKTRLDGID